ncbi:MAG: hypothetical protein IJK24_00365 [Oscillospiraceae bacterium]|nr:hypothetical protein [Oscillospiraceae bacterium]
MNITVIYHEQSIYERQIRKAISTLNSVQSYFIFSLQKTDLPVLNTDPVCWLSFSDSHSSGEGYNIFISDKPIDDNWFSHEERNFSLISLDSWEDSFSPPSLSAYIMYQIAQASINFEADLSEGMLFNLVHWKTQGCMFDFCDNKPDIKIGMVSGAICPTCRAALASYGTDEKALSATESILEAVRLEAIGKPILINHNEAFIVMRFSTHDENDHAYKYGIIPALNDIGINYRRGDDTILSMPILQKVQQAIKRSRFIIIKVDEKNLNVYFELGYAMGLGKPVLLISEEPFIDNLPTDIKNLECLTYPHGDYETLKEKVIKYFKDNYHIE